MDNGSELIQLEIDGACLWRIDQTNKIIEISSSKQQRSKKAKIENPKNQNDFQILHTCSTNYRL